MNIKASGRSALIIAAGLWMCASGAVHAAGTDAQPPEQAATVGTAVDTSAEPAKVTKHHRARKTASGTASKSRKADRLAAGTAKKPADDDTAKADDTKPATPDATLSPAVANANAQWPAPAVTADPAGNANVPTATLPAPAGIQQQQPAVADTDSDTSNLKVVASDQLNDLDRAATDNQPPLTLAKATLDTPTAEATSSNSPWDKTSMIGKIFVAFGGLLTMASAARMFMA